MFAFRLKMKSAIKYRIIDHKKRPICDYHGTCKNTAFREVYTDLGKNNAGWSYLCRKHFFQKKKKLPKLLYVDINYKDVKNE